VIEIINGRIIDWVQSVKITGFIKSGYPYKRGNLYFITHAVDDETYLINTLSNQQIVGFIIFDKKGIIVLCVIFVSKIQARWVLSNFNK